MMSNSQSKIEMNDDMCDGYYDQQTLVMYFGEIDSESGLVDMRCYVFYDQSEEEYFICGKRTTQSETEFSDFKLFCKHRKGVLDLLSNIMDTRHNLVDYTLYNFKDLFCSYDVDIDFDFLNSKRDIKDEINGFDNIVYDEVDTKTVLSIIKQARY